MATGKSGKRAAPVHGLPFCQLRDIRIGQHCGRKRWPMAGLRDCIEEREVRRSHPYHYPRIPVWVGFAESTFSPAKAGADLKGFARKGEVYTYQKHGFEATEYTLRTDQLGTQLDPPAHWAPEYPTIDELPASYAIRAARRHIDRGASEE